MHIPDGYLSAPVCMVTSLAAVSGLVIGLRKTSADLEERTVPRLALVAAFIFAAQLINFPVAAGTSGHLLGAAFATALLGPWAASVAIILVLIVQCLLFQDGGITALGANIVNMAFVAVWSAWIVQKAFSPRWRILGIALSAWVSIVAASALCAIELAISDMAPMGLLFPTIGGIHALIGVGETVITVLIFKAVMSISPEMSNRFLPESIHHGTKRDL